MKQPGEAADVATFLRVLRRPGEVLEVRIPKADGRNTASGYFDDLDTAAAAIARYDGRANVYVTLNPVRPALLARAANRINARATATTADADVLARRWVLVDIDPRRPSGISATDAERAASLVVARSVAGYLAGLGWCLPVSAMSGNGHALLYPVELPNDAAALELVRGFLAHLAARFDSEAVAIDPTVSNAARIGAAIGTLKVKGDDTADRPHRRSELLHVPAELVPVTAAQLEALGPVAAVDGPDDGFLFTDGLASGWVRRRVDAAGIEYRERERGGLVWFGLASCPAHPGDGEPFECGVGEAPDGRASGHCFHNRGAGWGWQQFRDALGLGGPAAPAFTSAPPSTFRAETVAAAPAWPDPPAEAAYHGVAGDLVRAVAEGTEADPVAVLGTILATAGALFGRYVTMYQGAAQAANLYVALVGDSSTGRKGTADALGRAIFTTAMPGWDAILVPGLGSGEGLIGRLSPKKLEGSAVSRPDHRALVRESELGRLLTIMAREGSTLSATLRDAWDGGPLGRFLAREDALVLWHHVGLLGHITPVELREKLTSVDAANGFGNRFLWLAVRGGAPVPFPKDPRAAVAPFLPELRAALEAAQAPRELTWTPAAAALWEALYAGLRDRPRLGLAGTLTARAEAQLVRLALVYALLDRASAVDVVHLEAAQAVWEYAGRSAVHVFGESTGNRHADLVLRLLRAEGEADRQTIKNETGLRFGADLDAIEALLVSAGLAELGGAPRADGRAGRPRRVLRLRSAVVTGLTGLTAHEGHPARAENVVKTTRDIPAVSPVSVNDATVRAGGHSTAVSPVRSDDDPGEGTVVELVSTPRVVPPEPPDLFALAPRPPCFADADMYRGHQSDHYAMQSPAPGCRRCEGMAEDVDVDLFASASA